MASGPDKSNPSDPRFGDSFPGKGRGVPGDPFLGFDKIDSHPSDPGKSIPSGKLFGKGSLGVFKSDPFDSDSFASEIFDPAQSFVLPQPDGALSLPPETQDIGAAPERTFGRLAYASHKDRGRLRETQQDYVVTRVITINTTTDTRQYLIMVVADGMGGHALGEQASLKAATTIPGYFESRLSEGMNISSSLAEAVVLADGDVRMIDKKPGERAPGTTATVAVIDENGHAFITSIGDSRAYIVDGNNTAQVTEDDSKVANLVKRGLITRDDIYTHPENNIITKSLGGAGTPLTQDEVLAKMVQLDIQAGQSLLLASDGLWEMVRDPEMGRIVALSSSSKDAVQNLIAAANANGGADNIGIALARNTETPKSHELRRVTEAETLQGRPDINAFLSIIYMQAGGNTERIPDVLRQILAQRRPDILSDIQNAQPGQISPQVEDFGVPRSLVARLGNWAPGFENMTQYSPLGSWKDLVVSIGLGMFSNATGRNVEWRDVEWTLRPFRKNLTQSFDLRSTDPLKITLSSAEGAETSQRPLNISVNGKNYTLANQEEAFVATLGAEYMFHGSEVSGVSLVIPAGQGTGGLELRLSEGQYLQLVKSLLDNSTSGRRKAVLTKYLRDFSFQTRGMGDSLAPDALGRTQGSKRAVYATSVLLGF